MGLAGQPQILRLKTMDCAKDFMVRDKDAFCAGYACYTLWTAKLLYPNAGSSGRPGSSGAGPRTQSPQPRTEADSRAGDWTCRCGYQNFSRAQYCKECRG